MATRERSKHPQRRDARTDDQRGMKARHEALLQHGNARSLRQVVRLRVSDEQRSRVRPAQRCEDRARQRHADALAYHAPRRQKACRDPLPSPRRGPHQGAVIRRLE